jgi:predicted Zn-dependent peptidase
MIDRKTPPIANAPKNVAIPQAECHILTNGVKVYVVNKGEVEVCRIDLLFDAGVKFQTKHLVANGTLNLMPEGTKNFSASQIADHLDFHGSYINRATYNDFSRLTVYSLNRYFSETLKMVEEVVKQPIYPNHEVDIWRTTGKQELSVQLGKTNALAQRTLLTSLFGANHPYGKFPVPTSYDNIGSSDLKEFHAANYGSASCTIFLSGNVTDNHLSLVEKHFGSATWGEKSKGIILPQVELNRNESVVFTQKADAVQSSLRIGRLLFPRTHPDFPEMVVLTTILGGYFGSRLMKNIREDKGFTYGIHASILPFTDAGVFQISTDVGANHTQDAINEILFEIKRIQSEPVEQLELDLVRGSLMGQFLRSFNGQFSISESFIWLLYFNNLDYSFYSRQINAIQTISPTRIMELANKWLKVDDITISVAGSVNPNSI